MDLKKSTKSNQKPFEDLCDKIRLIIDNMGKDVVNKVEVKIFEGVNDNINKIGKAEDEFKVVPGLISKSVYKNVISHIDKKIK